MVPVTPLRFEGENSAKANPNLFVMVMDYNVKRVYLCVALVQLGIFLNENINRYFFQVLFYIFPYKFIMELYTGRAVHVSSLIKLQFGPGESGSTKQFVGENSSAFGFYRLLLKGRTAIESVTTPVEDVLQLCLFGFVPEIVFALSECLKGPPWKGFSSIKGVLFYTLSHILKGFWW